jgi:predicted DNA-binding transcriptional regulator YafY
MPRSDSGRAAGNQRVGNSRRPLERITKIHEMVRRGGYPNCSGIAAEIEVTPKTIQRDITFMRDELQLPIEYDAVRHGYYYTREVGDFPLLEVTVEDAVALFLARRALLPLQNSPLEATLRESFRRLSRSLEGKVSFRWSDLDQAFNVRDQGIAKSDIATFEKLAGAVMESKEVSFEYRNLNSKSSRRRQVRPYTLSDVGGCWYLIGHDQSRDAVRTFAVPRIKALRVLTGRFVRPDDFDADSYLGESFGIWRTADGTGKSHRVRIRLEGWAARVAAERRWHPSQEIKKLKGKTEAIEIQFELANFEEIASWVMSWGALAEVLTPKALRDRVGKELRMAAKRY